MSSSIKEEKIAPRDLSLLNFASKLKLSIPFSVVYLNEHEKFIYQDTRNINFKDTLLEFQKIMKQEFRGAFKDLDINK